MTPEEFALSAALDHLAYDPETGLFHWKSRDRGRRRGAIAGSITSEGFIRIKHDGRQFYASRLAFFAVHRYAPRYVAHIDGNKTNNRASNLRAMDAKPRSTAGRASASPSAVRVK